MPIEPLEWKRFAPAYDMYRAETGEGFVGESWFIGVPKPTVEIKYRAPFPTNPQTKEESFEAYRQASARMKEIDGPGGETSEEWYRLFSYSHDQDLGWGPSHEMSRDLIERLRNNQHQDGAFGEVLGRHGFVVYENKYITDGSEMYVLNLKKGSLHVSIKNQPGDTTLSCRYDPVNSGFFHYLMMLYGERPSFDKKSTCYSFFPEGCDFLKVGVTFIAEVIAPWVRHNRMDVLSRRRKAGR